MSGYVATIPEWFPTRKAAQVTAFFALKSGGEINILMATKLIYLADRLSMQRREHPITGDNFVSMPFGPVNTYTYSLMNGNVRQGLDTWRSFIGPRDDNTLPLARLMSVDELDALSRADVIILNDTWDKFKDINRFTLAEWTHRFCPEWRDPRGSSIPIDFATVYNKLEKLDPVDLAEQIQAERSLFLELTNSARVRSVQRS